jgi:hypothetical protein
MPTICLSFVQPLPVAVTALILQTMAEKSCLLLGVTHNWDLDPG